jgi:hypothetical protein
MRTITALFVGLLLAGPTVAAPCPTSGGSNPLQSAAAGLGAHQWCELVPTNQNGATLQQMLTTCGDSMEIQNYAVSMAYDASRQKIYFAGTPHGGGYRQIEYDIATNRWSVLQPITGLCGSESTCTVGLPESGPIVRCNSCNAEHTYDGLTSDNAGNYYRHGFGDSHIAKITNGVWNTRWEPIQSGSANTGAMVFWPTYGAAGSLVLINGGGASMTELWIYDLAQDRWSQVGGQLWQYTYHAQIEYHPVADQIWIQQGNGGTIHYRLWLNNGTPTLTALGSAPGGRLGMTTSKCVADPSSDDKFICWDLSEDRVGSGPEGWYEFDLSENRWTPLSSLGITSMPPLFQYPTDAGKSGITVTDIPELGVTVWLTQLRDDKSGSGMFVYRHGEGAVHQDPPSPPPNLRPD